MLTIIRIDKAQVLKRISLQAAFINFCTFVSETSLREALLLAGSSFKSRRLI